MRASSLQPLRKKACWATFGSKNPFGVEPTNVGTKDQHDNSGIQKTLFSIISEND